MILAADIGGTKTVLALFDENIPQLEAVRQETFPSQAYPEFSQVLEKFLATSSQPSIRAASFGVAGPIIGGRVRTTNLPWLLDVQELAKSLHTERVFLLNDLQAAAIGMQHLKPEEFHVLNKGHEPQRPGHAVMLAAGTGLGEAILYWDGQRHIAMASEGGHCDYAPRSDQEIELFKYLRKQFKHVSYERVLSGPGLYHIYCFLRDTGFAEEPAWLKEKIQSSTPRTAAITELGLARAHPLCTESLSLFVRTYGAAAGNLALLVMATGGVYVGGGIAPRMLPKLADGEFMVSFTAKGRYRKFLAAVPVRVALNPLAPLLGAAEVARRSLH
jgi:glucokinase